MTINEILKKAIKQLKENNIDEQILKAKILLCFVLNVNKEYLIINDKQELDEKNEEKYEELINRLIDGEPLQYITGEQCFFGLKIKVNKSVLIPRPDTEILVEEIIKIAQKENIKILDLCTGSGAIAIALAKNIENVEVTATDISKKALEVSRENALLNNANINFIQSDLFQNIEDKFNIIVSNPPYIETDVIKTLNKDVQNEPIIALDGGKDGLDIYREIIDKAYKYLEEEGILALEIGYDQKEKVIDLIEQTYKYNNIYSKKDFGGNDRIIICKKNCQKDIEKLKN